MSLKSNIIILHNGLNPTSYYWLRNFGAKSLDFKNSINLESLYSADQIIIVRYIPFKLLFHLFILHKKGIKINLILDDDLLSLNLLSNLPINYKIKLFFRIYCFKHFLRFFISQIWVTNLKLKKKLLLQLNNKLKIKVLNLKLKINLKEKKLFRISFLGTSSHVLELRWIKNLFLKIQSQRDDCLIELFVDKKWRKYFREIPRIKMIYPMDWESFFLDTQNRSVDVVLNPILKSEFNLYRSPTKFFDTTRLGAVGIYSKTSPYSNFIKNNYDGILLKNDIDLWCNNINILLDNPKKREYIYLNAITKIS